jgi:hypothetical protein
MQGGPWCSLTNGLVEPTYVKKARLAGWRPWQQAILDSVKAPDDRKVNVILDETGGIGKTTIGMHLLMMGLGRRIPNCVSRKVIHEAVVANVVPCYLFDIPRAANARIMQEIFAAIEEIKSGYSMETRYKFQEVTFEPPAVWVFMNTMPDVNWLSKDRWALWSVDPVTLELEEIQGFVPPTREIPLSKRQRTLLNGYPSKNSTTPHAPFWKSQQ